jgi:hypothetical protein
MGRLPGPEETRGVRIRRPIFIKFGVYPISALKYSCEKARLVPTNRLAELFFKEFGLCPEKKTKPNQRSLRCDLGGPKKKWRF